MYSGFCIFFYFGSFSSFFAASITSSIVPLKLNALSGISSISQFIIFSNHSIVFSNGTYFHSIPVNCSATENG